MPTLDELIADTRRLIEDHPIADTLGAAIADATTTTVTVTTVASYATGAIIEVDDEVMRVTAVDAENDQITVTRGHMGTTAASHLDGAAVSVGIRWSRVNLAEAINTVVGDWCSYYFPKKEWDTTTAGSFTTNRWVYAVPATTLSVRRVAWKVPGYQALRNVPFNQVLDYPTAIVSTGRGVEVQELGLPGRAVHVYLERRWPEITDVDDLDTGFPSDALDLIPSGAILYLTGYRNIPKYRIDESEFHRNSGRVIPSEMSLSLWGRKMEDWLVRARQVASHYRDGSYAKTYVGGRF